MTLTPEEKSWLAEVEERCEKATEGPWLFEDAKQSGPSDRVVFAPKGVTAYTEEDEPTNLVCTMPNDSYGHSCNLAENGPFIAHSRTDIPRLLALVKRLVAENERLTSLKIFLSDSCKNMKDAVEGYVDLKLENARLREALTIVGVKDGKTMALHNDLPPIEVVGILECLKMVTVRTWAENGPRDSVAIEEKK